MLQQIRGITFSVEMTEMGVKTGQILCEMQLIYTKFKICERICKSKELMRKVRNKEGGAFFAVVLSFPL